MEANRAFIKHSWNEGTSSRRRGREPERDRVHAVTQPGWPRAIVEHVPEMRIAARARDLGADRAERTVPALDHVPSRDRLPETGPPGAGIELGLRVEQRGVAADAAVY